MKRSWILFAAVLVLGSAGYFAYRHWRVAPGAQAMELMETMPPDALAMGYLNAAGLRDSAFFWQLLALAPSRQVDAEYTQFLRATGFQYERDLDRAAIAWRQAGSDRVFFAVAEGHFDRKKITDYAATSGTKTSIQGREIFSVPVVPGNAGAGSTPPGIKGGTRQISFTFLGAKRLAITDDGDLLPYLQAHRNEAAADLHERAGRLAGSPLFVIARREAFAPMAGRGIAPGGLRFDQFGSLSASLRWVTLAARPDGDLMRVVAEGECVSEEVARQIAQTLEGLLAFARMGIDDPKARREMNPVPREALLEALRSAEVSRVARGETASVRVVLQLGPKLLAVARGSQPTK